MVRVRFKVLCFQFLDSVLGSFCVSSQFGFSYPNFWSLLIWGLIMFLQVLTGFHSMVLGIRLLLASCAHCGCEGLPVILDADLFSSKRLFLL